MNFCEALRNSFGLSEKAGISNCVLVILKDSVGRSAYMLFYASG